MLKILELAIAEKKKTKKKQQLESCLPVTRQNGMRQVGNTLLMKPLSTPATLKHLFVPVSIFSTIAIHIITIYVMFWIPLQEIYL